MEAAAALRAAEEDALLQVQADDAVLLRVQPYTLAATRVANNQA